MQPFTRVRTVVTGAGYSAYEEFDIPNPVRTTFVADAMQRTRKAWVEAVTDIANDPIEEVEPDSDPGDETPDPDEPEEEA